MYAVWIKKGEESGTVNYKVDGMPDLPCNIAVPITAEESEIAKHLLNVVVFDKVQGKEVPKPVIEKDIQFEGTTYHYKDGVYAPPIQEEKYKRMKELGLL